MNNDFVRLDTDVLVVGGGVAGSMAAIPALEAGLKVAICEKGKVLDHCGSIGCPFSFMKASISASSTLWRIGLANNSSAEFTGSSMPAVYSIPSDWSTRTTWPEWKGYSASYAALMSDITYGLGPAPNGVEFVFKTIDASPLVPELAVFSNGMPCGIIQICGVEYPGFGPPRATRIFGRTYRIYIPNEFLSEYGANTLRIRKLGHPYNRDLLFALSFTIDYMALEILSEPTPDRVHSKPTYMGVASTGYEINRNTVNNEAPALNWMGVAYSGNPQRVGFWSDITALQPNLFYGYASALRKKPIHANYKCRDKTHLHFFNPQSEIRNPQFAGP